MYATKNFQICIQAKTVPRANKGDQKLFLVTCLGACRDVGISLEVLEGDADLYAR